MTLMMYPIQIFFSSCLLRFILILFIAQQGKRRLSIELDLRTGHNKKRLMKINHGDYQIMIATMLLSTWKVHSIQLHLCNIEIKIQIVRDAHRAIEPSCFESPLLCPRHHGGRSVKMRYLMIVKL